MIAKLNIRRNVVTTVVAFFVNILLTFVGFRLVVQQGGTAALGLWAALTAAIYVIRLGDVGMGSATERHIAATDVQGDPERVRGYLDTAILLNTVLFLVLALVGWALLSARIDWAVPGNEKTQAAALTILPLMLAGFVVSNIANVITAGLRGLHLAWLAAYLSVAGAFLQMVVIVILVPTLGVEGLAWGQLAQSLLIGMAAWFLFNRHVAKQTGHSPPHLPQTGSRALLREVFGFSIRAQAVNLANGLLEPVSKLMVGHTAGMSVLGLYEMAYKIIALPRNAVVSGVLGLTPALTRLLVSEPDKALELYSRSRKLVTVCTGIVLTTVGLATPFISIVVLGQNDGMLVKFVWIMAAGFWLNAVGAPAYAIGFAAGKMNANLISTFLSLSVVLTIGTLLNYEWPIFGPVIASATALACGGLFILWRNQRIIFNRL